MLMEVGEIDVKVSGVKRCLKVLGIIGLLKTGMIRSFGG
jgi:hypothetical protein